MWCSGKSIHLKIFCPNSSFSFSLSSFPSCCLPILSPLPPPPVSPAGPTLAYYLPPAVALESSRMSTSRKGWEKQQDPRITFSSLTMEHDICWASFWFRPSVKGNSAWRVLCKKYSYSELNPQANMIYQYSRPIVFSWV